jgi:hypothetical protein
LLTLALGLQGGVGALLSDGQSAPIEGRLPVELDLGDRQPPLFGLEARAGVVGPRGDAAASRAEQQLALALERAVLRSPGMEAIWDRLVRARGAVERAGEPLVLAFDARTPGLRALPWEVLGALRPAESPLAGLHLVRLSPSDAPRALPADPAGRLQILGWIPDPDDPVCRRVRSRLEQAVDSLARTELVWIDPMEALPPATDASRVLHLVCHGELEVDQILLRAGDEGAASVDSAARIFAQLLAQVDLVVLDVCEASSSSVEALDSPAGRFAAAGVPGCVGPLMPLAEEASAVFTSALYGALAGGEPVVDAVANGRRALTAKLGFPHPHWRWWNPCLVASGPATGVHRPLMRPAALLAGWSAPARQTEAVLASAIELGRALGFVGVEQLVLALSQHREPGFSGAALQPLVDPLRRSLAAYAMRDASTNPPRSTERLLRLGGLLPLGWTASALTSLLLETPSIGLLVGFGAAQAARAGLDVDATIATTGASGLLGGGVPEALAGGADLGDPPPALWCSRSWPGPRTAADSS